MKKKWSQFVHTKSTFPPEGIFKKSAEEIADTMAKPEVSPKGIGSAIKMVQFFINRAGKNLPENQRIELEKAKDILHSRLESHNSRKHNI